MELRQRKGGDSSIAVRAGEATGRVSNDGPEEGTPDDRQIVDDDASEATDAVVGAAVRGGSLLMLLALIQRASTFILNVLLQRAMLSGTDTSHNSRGQETRQTSALEQYGAAAITLELISSTALFLAREPFRVALARSRVPRPEVRKHMVDDEEMARETARREAHRRRFVNTAWLSAPVGVAFATVVRLAYPWIIRNDAFDGVEENRQAATMVCIAAAVELMCEPLALIFQYRLLIDVRVTAEAAAVLVLGVSRYLLVTRAGMGVLSFGYAQLLHSVTLASVYVVSAARDVATATAAQQAQRRSSSKKTGVDDGSQGFARVSGWLPGKPSISAGDRNGRSRSEMVTDDTDGWVDKGQLKLAGALAGQSLLKHVLTEGDKIVLARATSLGPGCGDGGGHGCDGGVARVGCDQEGSLYEQGVYAVASGYGSLAARLLFQPVEEAARLMFSKLGAEEDDTKGGEQAPAMRQSVKSTGNGSSSGDRAANLPPTDACGDGRSHAARRRLRERMAVLLATLLKLVLTAGLVFVCFGFHYTETLLRLLLASRGGRSGGGGSTAVSEVAHVLSWYCVYVLFLAANGMCEAFACAVARGRQLTGMGAGLVVSFGAFWAVVGTLTGRFGTRGLVMANAVGMACRVICSAVFIRRFFLQKSAGAGGVDDDQSSSRGATEKNLWRQVVAGALPHPAVFVAMAASSVLAHASSPAQTAASGVAAGGRVSWDITTVSRHVGVGAACFGVTAAVFVRFERRFLREMGALWAARRRNRGSRGGTDGVVSDEAGDGRYKGD